MKAPPIYRLFVERKPGFDIEARRVFSDLKNFAGIGALRGARYFNRYDIQGLSEENVKLVAERVFSEPQSDIVTFGDCPLADGETAFTIEYLPGQYDQRADSARQCIALITGDENVEVRCGRTFALSGPLTEADISAVKKYLINPVDSREADSAVPKTLYAEPNTPDDIRVLTGFTSLSKDGLKRFCERMSTSMDVDDAECVRSYFAGAGRDPTETEIRVLDVYWSDHCRHTTFNTILNQISIEDGRYSEAVKKALANWRALRSSVYKDRASASVPPETLMDLALIGAKALKKKGLLADVEESAEINACSIKLDVQYTDGTSEPWLLMFKNETHNHPTEIEPFGGAATCIGGAIRDPLSGRAWVYQAMRITGSADPRKPLNKTLAGKLPQIKITRDAALGYSSYANQIGLAAGQVAEIYDPGFEAKRMELGAVIAAAPRRQVIRKNPEPGDAVILVGGGTGRDGIGGATGSSKAHTETSLTTAGAEVQKGNAAEERKIQRLFRNPDAAAMILRCNDFGAGGVAVAAGELAEGLEIDLDAVPKKYDGLNGTEIAISESQERMAVVTRRADAERFIAEANKENLQAAIIASISDSGRLIMKWRGVKIVDIERSFLNSCGAVKNADVFVAAPDEKRIPLDEPLASVRDCGVKLDKSTPPNDLKKAWFANISDLAAASQRGMREQFDGTIGSGSILFPFGGKNQATPEAGMAARIPSLYPKEAVTASLMTYGYDPRIASWSPFHGAQFAVLDSLTKILALGGDPLKAHLTFQEYFERTSSPRSWGKPAAALLGALEAQLALNIAAIGGKDSMSGSYNDLRVPPTLVSIAVAVTEERRVRGSAFTGAGNTLALMRTPQTPDRTPDWRAFRRLCEQAEKLRAETVILSAHPVGAGGMAAALTTASFGNGAGAELFDTSDAAEFFRPSYGSIIFELEGEIPADELPDGGEWRIIGKTIAEPVLRVPRGETIAEISLAQARAEWEAPLTNVFPIKAPERGASEPAAAFMFNSSTKSAKAEKPAPRAKILTAPPLAVIPVFPGTNCEYDMARAFRIAGADVKIVVFRNRTKADMEESLSNLASALRSANIAVFAGGFSAADEPDGSGKFIANVLHSPQISEAVTALLDKRDGLILGICNGFQALVKSGLLPYGKISAPNADSPSLTHNAIGRHVSRMVNTRLASVSSPWAQGSSEGDIFTLPVSHGEGRFIVSDAEAERLFAAGQIFSQYVDENNMPTMKEPWNPNGSRFAVEGIVSPDGRILGKMAHNERTIDSPGHASELLKNIPGRKSQDIFSAGVNYFT